MIILPFFFKIDNIYTYITCPFTCQLQTISKARHFPVRHILVILRLKLNLRYHLSNISTSKLRRHLPISNRASRTSSTFKALLLRPPRIHALQIESERYRQSHSQCITNHDSLKSGLVRRGFSLAEELWPDNVACTIGDELHGRHCHFLGDAAKVRLYKRHGEWHCCRAGGQEEVSKELYTVRYGGPAVDYGSTDDAGHHYRNDEEAV